MHDVLIIGAGPSGAIAAALLVQRGYSVLVLERETFPRFSIGESLLPHCMQFIEEAGMLEAVAAAGFQRKNGANFQWQDQRASFDFREKFTPGPGETWQVLRSKFDQVLAKEAARMGADIRYGHTIESVACARDDCSVSGTGPDGGFSFRARFLLDASGFGRVLSRLLDLEQPSNFPLRASLFCHISDQIDDPSFDREKILISVHPEHRDLWYWLIPFSNGRCSIGAVARPEVLDSYAGDDSQRLRQIVAEEPGLQKLLAAAQWDTAARQIRGYASAVSTLASDSYALLGNAGEFLDPVFSSGVTIAMRSASEAVKVLDRQLRGEQVDWQSDYAEPLQRGVDTFRTFVTAWYDGRFQDVIFFPRQSTAIREMISSILAGYAWDEANPYVANPERRLNALWQFCQGSEQSSEGADFTAKEAG